MVESAIAGLQGKLGAMRTSIMPLTYSRFGRLLRQPFCHHSRNRYYVSMYLRPLSTFPYERQQTGYNVWQWALRDENYHLGRCGLEEVRLAVACMDTKAAIRLSRMNNESQSVKFLYLIAVLTTESRPFFVLPAHRVPLPLQLLSLITSYPTAR